MQNGKIKLGLATGGAVVMTLGIAFPAYADYAPVGKDVVGVGSDTVQYASDFVADGSPAAGSAYNGLGNKYKIVNFDATPDANARLAYGPGGSGSTCAPGTGDKTPGSGTSTAPSSGNNVCALNPTIVLRAGQSPVQRPNGSGDGAGAISTDTAHWISYSRASSKQGSTLAGSSANQGSFDRLTLGTDKLAMIAATTTNAVPLSTSQLAAIYSCTTSPTDGTAGLEWKDVGGTSADKIIPLVPQVGSGTRKSFLVDIYGKDSSGNPLSNPGACVANTEENDPTAIAAATNFSGASDATPPKDAISPMSGGRLNLFQGIQGDGSSTGSGGYFRDPSCKLNQIAAGVTAPANGGNDCKNTDNKLNPAVAYLTGTPATGSAVFNSSNGGLYDDERSLYIYFRNSDFTSATKWQPGSTQNWVQTLFYNPCPDNPPTSTDGCTNDPIAGEVAASGAPYYATSAGQAQIAAAGITPAYSVLTGVTTGD